MRVFGHFPEEGVCKVCGTNEDKECILVPIDGTKEGNICQAAPVHVDCLKADTFRYNEEANLFYKAGI